jgi:hemerythrin-like domain-containing protein
MNLTDLPAGLDDPVDQLLTFHRRIERQLAELGRLPALLEDRGLDAEALRTVAAILSCFGVAALQHHADEERELLPLLERRIPEGGPLVAFQALRGQIEGDHREIERAWRVIRRPLEAIAEGIPRRLPVDEIRYFRALVSTHICAEEAALHLLALRHLGSEDRVRLALRMRARRERALRTAG